MEKQERPPVDPELRRRINELIAYKGGGQNPDLVADVIENALKLLTDVESRGDVRVIQTTVRELRYAFRLFAPHAGVRKVTMFGSARLQPSRKEYQEAVDFAQRITAEGWMVITVTRVLGRKKASVRTYACLGNKVPIQSSSTTKS